MNEHAPFWTRFNNLTPEAALALLRAKIPDIKCLACASSDIGLIADITENLHTRMDVYPFSANSPVPIVGYVPTLCFECHHCGYIQSFARARLDPEFKDSMKPYELLNKKGGG